MNLVTRRQWGARASRGTTPLYGSKGLVAHYNGPRLNLTAGCDDGRRCKAVVQATQRFHMDARGWNDIAYSFLTCPSCGRVYEGRGWGVRTAANGTNTGNSWGHAVMVLIGEGEPLTDTAKKSLLALAVVHRRRYSRHTWKTHGDFKATSCPGVSLTRWIRNGASPPPVPKPTPLPVEEEDVNVLKPGGSYGNMTRLLKRCLNNEKTRNGRTASDRMNPDSDVYGPRMAARIKECQRSWGFKETGEVDPATLAMLLRFE